MKRFRYGINHETTNMGGIGDLIPLGYVEVVPGDTVAGSVACRLISDVTAQPVYTRGYLDLFAFHVPFRLLWDPWADWIRTDGATGGPLPTVATAFPQNFEPNATAHLDFIRRAYNTVWNQFFRSAVNQLEINILQAQVLATEYRKSTYAESIFVRDEFPDFTETTVPVDTLAGSVSIDDLRVGFGVDRMKKLRSFYGQKYTDYLASLGVEASWSILEEPELIGRKSCDLTYRTTKATFGDSTTASALGQPGGQWEAHCTIPLKRTFCPEHGLIVVMAVSRVERYNTTHAHPLLRKSGADDFWRPELQYQRFHDATWLLGTNTALQEAMVPPFEDLRKGMNLVALPAGAALTEQYGMLYTDADQTVSDIITCNRNNFDAIFVGKLAAHYQVFNKFRLVKSSPVRPDVRNVGVQ